MAAQQGNKYAEKWTKELALEFISEVRECICQGAYHIGGAAVMALEKIREKYPQISYQERFIWNYLTHKFSEDLEVLHAIKKVEILTESKIVEDTLMGEIKSAPMAIFYLKNKFGYKDTSEQEVNLKGSIPIGQWLKMGTEKQDGGSF